MGGRRRLARPESRFLEQALVFFVPAYAVTLLFILGVALGGAGALRAAPPPGAVAYGRAFGAAFPVLFFVASVVLMWAAEREALKQAPGSLVAPLLAAAAPFAAARRSRCPGGRGRPGPLALLWKASAA